VRLVLSAAATADDAPAYAPTYASAGNVRGRRAGAVRTSTQSAEIDPNKEDADQSAAEGKSTSGQEPCSTCHSGAHAEAEAAGADQRGNDAPELTNLSG
jgi:hypothetical protein